MNTNRHLLPALLICVSSLVGCSDSRSPPASAAAPDTSSQPSAPDAEHQAKVVEACKLITAEEIKALAGEPLEATPDGKTGCVWQAANSALPHIEFKIDRGSAEIAMTAFGMLAKHEPGISNPYDGLGDEAVAIGPSVQIKRDEDLITIIVMGVDDNEAAVRKIYETATARM